MTDSRAQYNRFAKEYDEQSRTAAPWIYLDKPAIQEEFLPVAQSADLILDVGCGSGKALDLLAANGIPQRNMAGIDSSEGLLAIASANLPESTLLLGDISDPRHFSANHFGCALSVRVLEYLSMPALTVAMDNVFAALKPGSMFFVIVGHPLRVNNGDLREYLAHGVRTVSLPWGMQVDLYHKTVSDYVNSALGAGFSISHLEEVGMPLEFENENPEAYRNYLGYGATNLHLLLQKPRAL